MGLTAKRRAFIEYYLQTWNASEAARLAGYSERTAYSQGPRLLKVVEVQDAIQERLKELKMDADEWMMKLTDIARSSPDIFLKFDGSFWKIDLSKAKAQGKLHLIKSIQQTQYGMKVELHDPQRALDLIGKAKQFYKENIDITSDGEPLQNNVIRVVVHDDREEPGDSA